MKELKNRLAAFSKTTLGSALAIAFFFVMFILLQIPSTFALGGAINSVTPEGIKKFVIAYALCSVLTIYLFARFRWAPVSREYIRTLSQKQALEKYKNGKKTYTKGTLGLLLRRSTGDMLYR